MTMRLTFISMLAAIACLASPPAAADSMRCGVHIISASGFDGPTMYEVLKKCGEPTFRYGRRWTYESASQLTRTLVFNAQGRLVEIETG